MVERPSWQPLLEARLAGRRLLLALDYDGTLAPFQVDRLAAKPLPGTLPLLAALQERADTQLVLVSGRPIDELVLLLGERTVPMIGSHGFERQDPGAPRRLEGLAPELAVVLDEEAEAARRLGLIHERKVGSVAVHTRALAPAAASSLHEQLLTRWRAKMRPGLEARAFDGGVELRVSGIDKGTALARWLDEQGAGDHVVLYLGDDQTDEDAFALLPKRGGLGVKVGTGPSCAELRVADCAEVQDLLAWLARRPVAWEVTDA